MRTDISRQLILTSEVQQQIGMIFRDHIILDARFRFVSISQNILDAMSYTREELLGKSVKLFSKNSNLEVELGTHLQPGYFADELIEFHRRDGAALLFSVSGFYLGLISDINGLIILKLINQDEISIENERLAGKTLEIDRFVYVAAHALRGPLATIRGLVNLAGNHASTDELKFIVNQLDQSASKLDEKIYQLIYFSESDKGFEVDSNPISATDLSVHLKSVALSAMPGNISSIRCTATHDLENGEMIRSLFGNLISFFAQQQVSSSPEFSLDAHTRENAVEIVFNAKGFAHHTLLRQKMSIINCGYSEILNHPELLNFYAAKKVMFRLRGEMQLLMSGPDEYTVLMTIPHFNQTGNHALP